MESMMKSFFALFFSVLTCFSVQSMGAVSGEKEEKKRKNQWDLEDFEQAILDVYVKVLGCSRETALRIYDARSIGEMGFSKKIYDQDPVAFRQRLKKGIELFILNTPICIKRKRTSRGPKKSTIEMIYNRMMEGFRTMLKILAQKGLKEHQEILRSFFAEQAKLDGAEKIVDKQKTSPLQKRLSEDAYRQACVDVYSEFEGLPTQDVEKAYDMGFFWRRRVLQDFYGKDPEGFRKNLKDLYAYQAKREKIGTEVCHALCQYFYLMAPGRNNIWIKACKPDDIKTVCHEGLGHSRGIGGKMRCVTHKDQREQKSSPPRNVEAFEKASISAWAEVTGCSQESAVQAYKAGLIGVINPSQATYEKGPDAFRTSEKERLEGLIKGFLGPHKLNKKTFRQRIAKSIKKLLQEKEEILRSFLANKAKLGGKNENIGKTKSCLSEHEYRRACIDCFSEFSGVPKKDVEKAYDMGFFWRRQMLEELYNKNPAGFRENLKDLYKHQISVNMSPRILCYNFIAEGPDMVWTRMKFEENKKGQVKFKSRKMLHAGGGDAT